MRVMPMVVMGMMIMVIVIMGMMPMVVMGVMLIVIMGMMPMVVMGVMLMVTVGVMLMVVMGMVVNMYVEVHTQSKCECPRRSYFAKEGLRHIEEYCGPLYEICPISQTEVEVAPCSFPVK